MYDWPDYWYSISHCVLHSRQLSGTYWYMKLSLFEKMKYHYGIQSDPPKFFGKNYIYLYLCQYEKLLSFKLQCGIFIFIPIKINYFCFKYVMTEVQREMIQCTQNIIFSRCGGYDCNSRTSIALVSRLDLEYIGQEISFQSYDNTKKINFY